jgi:thioesterase domain-containing protein/acyl carrier protein
VQLSNLTANSYEALSPTTTWPDARPAPTRARTPENEELARLWAELLQLNRVDIDDDFFELGGDSMLAVELFVRLEQLYGKNLPLTTLIQAPTVRQMAKVLRNEGAPPQSWPSLVQLQPGTEKAPVFCVHAIGGNILNYSPLARYLGRDQPVYGLRARGLDGTQEPHNTVEEMAADYIDEIRQVQPEGPYYLSGYSFGGLVAYEIARQLRAQGQEIALLAMIDTRKAAPPALPHLLQFFLLLGRLNLGALARKIYTRVTWWLARAFSKLTNAPLSREFRHSRSMEVCSRAAKLYVPETYPGRVTFFRAKITRDPLAAAQTQIKWNDLALGGVETHEIACEHAHMLDEPHIQVLASKLKGCLERAGAFVGAPCRRRTSKGNPSVA